MGSPVIITPDSSEPITITPDTDSDIASISAYKGTPEPSPGLQYSRGYGGTEDDQRKFSGGFVDRATSYLGENLSNAFNHPLDTIKNAITTAARVYGGDTTVGGQLAHRYTNDPAALAGDVGTQALLSTVMGKPPGINMAEASAGGTVPEGLAHPLAAIQRGASALQPNLAELVKKPISSTVMAVPNAVKAAMGNDIQVYPVARTAPQWQSNPSAGTEVPSIMERGAPPVNNRTTYPNTSTYPGARLPKGAGWQINPGESANTPSILDRPGPQEAPTPQQIVQKIRDIGNQPQPKGVRPAPQWQTNPHPVEEFPVRGSTPEEIQAQLTRMANRPRTSRPEGATAESPYQVQNIPVQGAKPPASQGTIPNLPEMQPSQSTTIAQHGYDPVKQQMTVQFKNGNVYRYSGVPQKVFDQYQSSESQGSFHANNIKGRYQTDKIGTVKPTQAQKISQALGGNQ